MATRVRILGCFCLAYALVVGAALGVLLVVGTQASGTAFGAVTLACGAPVPTLFVGWSILRHGVRAKGRLIGALVLMAICAALAWLEGDLGPGASAPVAWLDGLATGQLYFLPGAGLTVALALRMRIPGTERA